MTGICHFMLILLSDFLGATTSNELETNAAATFHTLNFIPATKTSATTDVLQKQHVATCAGKNDK